MICEQVKISPLTVILNVDPLELKDNKLMLPFQETFLKAQENFSPYFVVKVTKELNEYKWSIQANDISKGETSAEGVQYCAYRCFSFDGFQKGKEPQKTIFENEKLQLFEKGSQRLIGTDPEHHDYRTAQCTVSFHYFSKKENRLINQIEGVRWAWSASKPQSAGIQSLSCTCRANHQLMIQKSSFTLIGRYFCYLAQEETAKISENEKIINYIMFLYKKSIIWFKKGICEEDDDNCNMIDLIQGSLIFLEKLKNDKKEFRLSEDANNENLPIKTKRSQYIPY